MSETAPSERAGRAGGVRLTTVFTAAFVLLCAWVAGRHGLGAGIAVGILGLAVAYARGGLAVPLVAVVTAALFALVAVAAIALLLALVYGFGSMLLGWGGAPESGTGLDGSGGGFHGGSL